MNILPKNLNCDSVNIVFVPVSLFIVKRLTALQIF